MRVPHRYHQLPTEALGQLRHPSSHHITGGDGEDDDDEGDDESNDQHAGMTHIYASTWLQRMDEIVWSRI